MYHACWLGVKNQLSIYLPHVSTTLSAVKDQTVPHVNATEHGPEFTAQQSVAETGQNLV